MQTSTPHFVYLHKNTFEKNAILDNKKFNHLRKFSPLSGSEPKYEPKKWNDNEVIKKNHNCYSYALNQINPKRKGKPQPGYFSGYDHIGDDEYKCENFYKRLKDDIPSLYLTSFENKCQKGFHKSFIAIDPKNGEQDYHFYRQDNNYKWSHKPGRTDAIDKDASGEEIKNPLTANRLSYNKPCFFFCVHEKLGRAHGKRIKNNKSFFHF